MTNQIEAMTHSGEMITTERGDNIDTYLLFVNVSYDWGGDILAGVYKDEAELLKAIKDIEEKFDIISPIHISAKAKRNGDYSNGVITWTDLEYGKQALV